MEPRLGVVVLVFDLLKVACLDIPPAKPLLTYDYKSEKFVLGDDALRELKSIQGPLRIISVIGDARVGKSTNLNLIRYFLDGKESGMVQNVFKTSESMVPCTSGAWMSVVRDANDAGNTILIDTEGTNMGDNEVTDLLSIFAVLMSSGVALFAREAISNHNIQFLYRVSRLSEQIWENDDMYTANSYPGLMVVIRDALSPSPGKTLQMEIQDMILNSKSKYGQTINRLFTRDRVIVRDIPFVKDSKRLTDLEHEYANIASSLANDFKRFPCKRTVRGGVLDGKMISDLATRLQEAINRNSWKGFSNAYIALETNLCDRRFKEIVEPLLDKDVDEIKLSIDRTMGQFAENCAVTEEIQFTRERVASVIALKDEIKKKQKRLDEERERRRIQEESERELEKKRRREIMEREERLEEERRAREKAEEQRRVLEERVKRAEEQRKVFEAEAAARRTRERERRDIVRTVLGGAVLFGVFSDSRLKENITAVPRSKFEEIGLQGYSWVWSRKATEELGMRGQSSGVIAQEVEKLYPWIVVTGDDGYKRVYYEVLEELIISKKNHIT